MAASFMKGLLSPRVRSTSSSSLTNWPMVSLASIIPSGPRDLQDIIKDGSEAEVLQALANTPNINEMVFPYKANFLHFAARSGWDKVVEDLIQRYDTCHIQSKDERGWTPLHYAVVYHQLSVVQLLVGKFNTDLLCKDNCENTPIHLACHHGYETIVAYFKEMGRLDLSVVNENGDTPFHLACAMFKYMVVFLLENCTVDLNAQNKFGRSPVQSAILQGQWEIALYLVKNHGCCPSGVDHYGSTLLHELSRRGMFDCFKEIASSNSLSLSSQNGFGDTPLHIACRHAHSSIVDYLVSQESINLGLKNEVGLTPVGVACHHSNWQIGLKLITECGCSPVGVDQEGNNYIHGACMTNNFNAVRHIVSNGSVSHTAQNKKGDTPLHFACYNGNTEIVHFLVSLPDSTPFSANEIGDTPLHFASMAGHANVIEFLMKGCHGDSQLLNKAKNSPLHLACEYGHTEAAKMIVSLSQNNLKELIEMKNNQGKTPTEVALICQKWNTAVYMATLSETYVPAIERHLHLFCSEGFFDLIKDIFATLQVDVNCRDRFKNTPLHHACKSGVTDIIDYLLSEVGADPTSANELLNTPIHTASLEGHLEAVSLLLNAKGVDPNVANKEKNTPLHMACSRRHYDVILLLLKTGRVDPFPVNKDGKTPLDSLTSSPVTPECSEVLQLFESLKSMIDQYPVHTYTKVIICGASKSGKSSLAKVLLDRASNRRRFSRSMLAKKYVSGVHLDTPGMISCDIQTPDQDNIMLYDLSGQVRYHSSHIAYLKNLNITSPSVFLLMVNVKLSEEEIKDQLKYWYSLIVSTCNPLIPKSRVLVIGSHVDGLEKKDIYHLKALIDETMAMLEQCVCSYSTNHFLNCSKLHSKRLNPFFSLLTENCKSLPSSSVSPYSHFLYSFLVKHVTDMKAITLVNLVHMISTIEFSGQHVLPSQTQILEELLVSLRDRGLINLITSDDPTCAKWIVVNPQYICYDLIGSLFAAPTTGGPEQGVALQAQTSTGIVPVHSLEAMFPDCPSGVLVGLLQALELCYEVNVKALTQIPNNVNTVESKDRKRRLFFPNFVSLEEKNAKEITCGTGWCLLSSTSCNFLTPYLSHTIMLRLLRQYCLPDFAQSWSNVTPVSSFEIWKDGLRWVTSNGIEVTIRVCFKSQRVTLSLSYTDEAVLEHVSLRNELILSIRAILSNLSVIPLFDFKEYLVPSSQVTALNHHQFDELQLCDIEEISNAILSGRDSVSLENDRLIALRDLICDDPYLRLPMNQYQSLHDSTNSSEIIPGDQLDQLHSRCGVFLSNCPGSSFESVREHLDSFTVLKLSGVVVSVHTSYRFLYSLNFHF